MAAEITVSLSVGVANGSFKDRFAPGTYTVDQAAVGGGNPGEVDVGTSEEDIAFGDVTPGLVCLQNLDGTNYVEYGPKSAGSMILFGRLKPGQSHVLYLAPAVTIRAKANTATCKVLIKGYN